VGSVGAQLGAQLAGQTAPLSAQQFSVKYPTNSFIASKSAE
jgi:hypothetical protein